jgi:CRISPR-associated endonuclease/helicase Cas3
VAKRLCARKTLTISDLQAGQLADWLADEAWALAEDAETPIRCVVYCDRREDAERIKGRLDMLAGTKKGPPKADTELLVGARRVKERKDAQEWLQRYGFLGGAETMRERPVILIATSAGEVGVDLDADHMVCDLVPWERMVQRLGRVNRRGERSNTEVRVVDGTAAEKDLGRVAILRKTRSLLERLPRLDSGRNASPEALLALRESSGSEATKAASTPEPLRPGLTRALVDAWSMTSLEDHTGRPEMDPWLRGWVEDDRPQTTVVWRTFLPLRSGVPGWPRTTAEKKEIEDFFEAAPPHESERLETETYRLASWLQKRAQALLSRKRPAPEKAAEDETSNSDVPEAEDINPEEQAASLAPAKRKALKRSDTVALLLSSGGAFVERYALDELAEERKGDAKKGFEQKLTGKLVILDARIAGLKDGLLNTSADDLPETADTLAEWSEQVGFRVRQRTALSQAEDDWRFEDDFILERDDEGAPVERLVVEHFKQAARREDARSIAKPQELVEHQHWTRLNMLHIAKGIGLSGPIAYALALAASLHDEGKKAVRWQRAFKAPRDARQWNLSGPLAKTRGPIDQGLLDGYRHEFGSLFYVEMNTDFAKLPTDLRDLVLHLVSAHHGFARPVIDARGCEDGPPSALEARAREVALRFARLQKRWGPWGLAWLEALLRASDAQASRDNDEGRIPARVEAD